MSLLTLYPALPNIVGSTRMPRRPESIPFRCPTPGCGSRQYPSVTVQRPSGKVYRTPFYCCHRCRIPRRFPRPVKAITALKRIAASSEGGLRPSFVAEVFAALDLDWMEHVGVRPALFRPTDWLHDYGKPEGIERDLGWHAECPFPTPAKRLVRPEISGEPE